MNEAAERFYAQRVDAREASRRREERARELRRELKKTAAEERLRLDEIGEAAAAQLLQAAGTALNLAAGETPRGASTFSVRDPATGEMRELPLDPSLGPRQNAEALFRRARKLRRREALAVQKLPAVANRRRLLEEELALVPTLPLEALAGPAREGPTARRAGAGGAPSATPPGIREYRLPGGWRILVGKSGAGNDRLTGRLASPEDYWFHARDFPGAHVVLKGAGAQPPEEAIRAAGAAAAWHSGARSERLVDVSYTKRKNVRKVKGGPPGKVLVGESSTIRVRPGLPPGAGESPA
jgi:predicted ribosome quality control (RQC) complex YloA/Tae2 family protein